MASGAGGWEDCMSYYEIWGRDGTFDTKHVGLSLQSTSTLHSPLMGDLLTWLRDSISIQVDYLKDWPAKGNLPSLDQRNTTKSPQILHYEWVISSMLPLSLWISLLHASSLEKRIWYIYLKYLLLLDSGQRVGNNHIFLGLWSRTKRMFWIRTWVWIRMNWVHSGFKWGH